MPKGSSIFCDKPHMNLNLCVVPTLKWSWIKSYQLGSRIDINSLPMSSKKFCDEVLIWLLIFDWFFFFLFFFYPKVVEDIIAVDIVVDIAVVVVDIAVWISCMKHINKKSYNTSVHVNSLYCLWDKYTHRHVTISSFDFIFRFICTLESLHYQWVSIMIRKFPDTKINIHRNSA